MGTNDAEFARLEAVIRRLEKAGAGGLTEKVGHELARTSRGLIRDGFAKQQDPDGHAWKPKKRPNGRPTLDNTGAMKRGWRVVWQRAVGLLFTNPKPYAEYHQGGTDVLPERKMIPDKGRLPVPWARAWDKVAMASIARFFQK